MQSRNETLNQPEEEQRGTIKCKRCHPWSVKWNGACVHERESVYKNRVVISDSGNRGSCYVLDLKISRDVRSWYPWLEFFNPAVLAVVSKRKSDALAEPGNILYPALPPLFPPALSTILSRLFIFDERTRDSWLAKNLFTWASRNHLCCSARS